MPQCDMLPASSQLVEVPPLGPMTSLSCSMSSSLHGRNGILRSRPLGERGLHASNALVDLVMLRCLPKWTSLRPLSDHLGTRLPTGRKRSMPQCDMLPASSQLVEVPPLGPMTSITTCSQHPWQQKDSNAILKCQVLQFLLNWRHSCLQSQVHLVKKLLHFLFHLSCSKQKQCTEHCCDQQEVCKHRWTEQILEI